jgi:hypothetical protein
VRARHLGIPRQRDVGLLPTANRHARPVALEHQDVPLAGAVAPVQERHTGTFGLD